MGCSYSLLYNIVYRIIFSFMFPCYMCIKESLLLFAFRIDGQSNHHIAGQSNHPNGMGRWVWSSGVGQMLIDVAGWGWLSHR